MTSPRAETTAQTPSLEHAVAALEALVGAKPHPDAIPKALRTVRQALEDHCATMEEPQGGFDQILSHAPHLSHEVAGLRIEHAAARASLDNLVEMIDHAPSLHHPAMLVAMIGRVRLLIAAIERHHRHTAHTLHEAFVAETGEID